MAILFANNAEATLASPITNATTSISLAAGKGALFPSPSGGDYFLLTLTQAGQETSWEIVKVTARSGDTLTVVRAQEGTTAAAWSAGDKAELRLTAGAITGKKDSTVSIDNKTSAYTVVAGDLGKIINCTSGTFTVSLTAAATLGAGFNCWVWNTSSIVSDAITIDPNGSETIDGLSTLILRRGEGLQIVCDGTNWQTGDKKAMRGYAENIQSNSTRPVASGSGSVSLGLNSTSSGTASFSAGGYTNASGIGSVALGYYYAKGAVTASGANSFAFGDGSTASSSSAVALGGNSAGNGSQAVTNAGAMALGGSYASGTDSFAAAIASNTSTYGATGAGAVSLGQLNLASAANAVALGAASTASGSGAFAYGSVCTASATYSYASGRHANAAQYGKQAFASGRFAANGDAQSGKMVLRRQTTDGTQTILTSDGSNSSGVNFVLLPDDTTVAFKATVVARNTGNDADSKVWEITGAVRRGVGAATTAYIGTPSINLIASDGSAWSVVLGSASGFGGMTLFVTGEAGKTINWVATVWTTEVTG